METDKAFSEIESIHKCHELEMSKEFTKHNVLKDQNKALLAALESVLIALAAVKNTHIGEQCPRCCDSVLEDDQDGHAVCMNENGEDGERCGFSTEGLDDE